MNDRVKLVDGPGEPGLVSVIIPTYNRAYIVGRAVDDGGRVLHETYLRTMYSAHRKVRIEEVLDRAGELTDLLPADPLVGGPVYTGDLFSCMMLGNLVHTSTVLLRRERLARVGGF